MRSDVALPAVLRLPRSTSVVRSNPLLLLVGKELRLQQLTFVVSLFYVLLSMVIWVARATLLRAEDVLLVATVVHAAVIAALAGSFACAEERVIGTLEWQLLQPVSARLQFAIKTVTATALTLLLAIGVPGLLSAAFGMPMWQKLPPASVAVPVLSWLAGSMYVCSLAPNALTGLLLCVPAFALGLMFVQIFVLPVVWWAFRVFHTLPSGHLAPQYAVSGRLDVMLWAALALLVLTFAFDNYRQGDRPVRRPALQLLALAGLVTIVGTGFAVAGRILFR